MHVANKNPLKKKEKAYLCKRNFSISNLLIAYLGHVPEEEAGFSDHRLQYIPMVGSSPIHYLHLLFHRNLEKWKNIYIYIYSWAKFMHNRTRLTGIIYVLSGVDDIWVTFSERKRFLRFCQIFGFVWKGNKRKKMLIIYSER